MIAREGLGIIIGSFILFFVSVAVWYFFPHPLSLTVSVLLGIFSVFNLFFFRDPKRDIPKDPLAVLSPADGRVVTVEKIAENEYFKGQVYQISIFLSVFNVHVNRVPISGTVDYLAYKTGKFLAAFKKEASEVNEQTAIGIVNEQGHRVFFKQIAGIIARRIICHLHEGDVVKAGDRFGLIRYGSRMDVFLPLDARVHVQIGQTVKGGESILATFPGEGGLEYSEETILETPKTEVS